MWREGEGKYAPAQITRFGALSEAKARPRTNVAPWQWNAQGAGGWGVEPPRLAESGTQDDRGALEGGDDLARGRMTLARALEQHPALESARTHEREALEDPVANLAIVGGH